MTVSFTQPLALLLLALLPLTVWAARESMAAMPRARRRAGLGLRLVLLTLLVLAVAGMQIVQTVDNMAVVFLLDRSDSVPAAQQDEAVGFVRQALPSIGKHDQAAVVAFGGDAVVDRPLNNDTTLPDVTSKPVSSFSNLAEAIRLGTALIPPDAQGRLVLLSDGNENLDSAESAARLAAARGVKLDVLPLAVPPGREVLVDNLEAPGNVREGERFDLRITIRSTGETSATIRLLADGGLIGTQDVRLSAGTTTFVQPVVGAGKGFHSYQVEVSPPAGADTRPENNQYSAYSFVSGKPRALLVEGHPDEAAPLKAALTAAGVDSDVTPDASLPLDLKKLAVYEAVVLVDVPLPELAQGAQPALQTYVRDLGRGLIVVGGEESYGAGGYSRSLLEQMLPVTMDLPSQLEIPAVAMALVIDRSGSMEETQGGSGAAAGMSKIELAKEAAYQAINQLNTRDSVGVVTFDTQAAWVVPLQKMGDPEALRSQLATIGPGGGTYIYSGLAAAVDALEKSNARGKHIVLLTDGQSGGGDYEGLLKRMDTAHITLSTVGLGSDVDGGLLGSLASKGGGTFYNTLDAGSLPAIFAHESHLASRSYLIEHQFVPKRNAPSPILQDIADTPPLLGYVGTTIRPAAVQALVSDIGDPLLAHWQYGLGRVAAWTSDAKGRWAKDWVGWSGFPTFWGAAARWAMGTDNSGGLQARVDLQDNKGLVSLDAVDGTGSPINGLHPAALVVPPASATSAVSSALNLRQTAPGHYEGQFAVGGEGAYLVRVQSGGAADNSGTPVPSPGGGAQTVGLVVPYSPEYRALPGNNGLLGRLTATTGGRALTDDASGAATVFRHDLPPVSRATDLWPLLLLLAILLLPFDIGVRRVMIGPSDLPRFLGEVRGRLAPAFAPSVPSDASASAALGPLFEARRHAEGRSRPPAPEIAARIEREARAGDITHPATPTGPAAPPASGNLAGEVLKRRRDRG
ncbi:MAG: VWA domain-containing protein [Chloroflexia bacterium]